jgi:hypothetical protein
MNEVAILRVRAKRLLLLRELVETFDDPAERKRVVMRLWEAKLVSNDSTRLLIEHFSLEEA